MTVSAVWVDPSATLTLDKATGDVVTETYLDGIVSDLLVLGGTTGRRPAVRREWAKGANIDSAATLVLGTDGNTFTIAGTTTITAITALAAGTIVTLIFSGALKVTHGTSANQPILAGTNDFYTQANSRLVLVSDGTNFYELARVHGTATAASTHLTVDVAMATNGTFYDAVSLPLVAGTWEVIGRASVSWSGGANVRCVAKLWDGSTVYDQCPNETGSAANTPAALVVHAVITLTATTTIKISCTGAQTNMNIDDEAPQDSAGDYSTGMTATRIA